MEYTIKEFMELVEEIKEMDTYKEVLKDSYGGVMYGLNTKENYNDDIKEKFKELESMGFDIWTTTDGIFRGVHHFVMREV